MCSVLVQIMLFPLGTNNKEFSFCHDWNTLISDNPSLEMRHYSEEYFPPADDYVSS